MSREPAEPDNDPEKIFWDEAGQPVSARFDDIYFSRDDGLAKTRQVFLEPNHLAQRFAALAPGESFTIGETGFGTGRNLLATWQLWRAKAPAGARLHFVSAEKHPLSGTDLARALTLWPELAELGEALLAAYPAWPGPGFHRLTLEPGRVYLTLMIGDAADVFEQLQATDHPDFVAAGPRVDAWFLDGFAPAKNPDIWRPAVFDTLARLSGPGTTAAAVTDTDAVRRALEQAGFAVEPALEKVAGASHEREWLRADWRERPAPPPGPERGPAPRETPWHLPEHPHRPDNRHAWVIGAGLAGCHTARALAERGWAVTVLERGDAPGCGASGNRQGVLYTRLSPRREPQGQFNLAALQYAQHHYQPYWQDGQMGRACGVLQLMGDERLEALRPLFGGASGLVEMLDRRAASHRAGVELPGGGLYFPHAGYLAPARVCRALLEHPNIELRTHTALEELTHRDGQWHLAGAGWQARTPTVVLANAAEATRFAQGLPVKRIRGQVSQLPATAGSERLRCVLCAEGYLTPAESGEHSAGATFDLRDEDPAERMGDHRANLDKLRVFGEPLYGEFAGLAPADLSGRVGFRCATPDYLPILGPAPAVDTLRRDFAAFARNAKSDPGRAGQYRPGLYLNIGHGSRGLAYTPLCAELLAAQISGEPAPVERTLVRALSPARFTIRDIKRSGG